MERIRLLVALLIPVSILAPLHTTAQWTRTQGLENQSVTGFAASDDNLVAGVAGGFVYLSRDSGTTWIPIDTIASYYVYPWGGLVLVPNITLIGDGSSIYAGVGNTDSGSVYVSTDDGLTWVERDSTFAENVNCFATIDSSVFAGTNDGVYCSSDNGHTWKRSNVGLSFENYDSIYHHAPQVIRLATGGTNIFAGTTGEGVFLSTNRGATWTAIDSGLTNLSIYGLATIAQGIFAGASGAGVFRSSNAGSNWSPANVGLTNRMINTLIASDSNLYAGTNMGVFLSTNCSNTWTDISAGTQVDSSAIISLAVCDGYLFAGTNSNGVWRHPLPEINTSTESDSKQLPSQLVLEQNYPNPFNPTTIITYELAIGGIVKLEVYDLLGRKTETLVNRYQYAGVYSVMFNATSLPSGAYFYRITTNGFVQAKKLLVIK
jgi:ligand-binding sensor domain-containing protein